MCFGAVAFKRCSMRVLGWRMVPSGGQQCPEAWPGAGAALGLGFREPARAMPSLRGCKHRAGHESEPLSCLTRIPALAPDNSWYPGPQDPLPKWPEPGVDHLAGVWSSDPRGGQEAAFRGLCVGLGVQAGAHSERAEGFLQCRIYDVYPPFGTGTRRAHVCVRVCVCL